MKWTLRRFLVPSKWEMEWSPASCWLCLVWAADLPATFLISVGQLKQKPPIISWYDSATGMIPPLCMLQMVSEISANTQERRLQTWTPPPLSSSHWMGNLYLRSLLSCSIKGIFYVHSPRSIHPKAKFSLLNTVGSSGSWHILNHWSRLTFHAAINPSGPHHLSQWET